MTALSDATLASFARRIRDGDLAAFESLFRALHSDLCDFADSFVKSPARAEEIVQDVFLAVWAGRTRWKPASARAYLFAAVRNRALEELRRRGVRTRAEHRAPEELQRASSGPAAFLPDRELECDEARIAVTSAMEALAPRAREAFRLQHEHELSQADIATAMGISVKGVEKLLASARGRLRVLLGRFEPRSDRS